MNVDMIWVVVASFEAGAAVGMFAKSRSNTGNSSFVRLPSVDTVAFPTSYAEVSTGSAVYTIRIIAGAVEV